MADREKVVKALKFCKEGSCPFCPYYDEALGGGCGMYDDALELLQAPEIVRCKDCLYFETKDFWGEFNGIPVLGASNQPTCTKWGDGDCKTSPDGYCFLAERR